MDEPILEVENLAAGYAGRPVVAGIDITLQPGEVLGLLGANGSGKSTLLKTITGQLPPLAGSIRIAGYDLARTRERAQAQFGIAIDGPDLPAALTGRQYLDLVASIRGCAPKAWPCGDVLARLAATAWAGRPIAEYSLGTRAKFAIAAALLGAPALLIFDEALNGLDPLVAWEVKTIIAELAATARHAVIISTHVVETIPTLCSHAIFLSQGRIAASWDRPGLAAASASPGAFEAAVIHSLKAAASGAKDAATRATN